MRAYLIKDEGTFERLALEKYQEDNGKTKQPGSNIANANNNGG